MIKEKLVCSICGAGPFKSPSGLAGHQQITHSEISKTVKIKPDEITSRLKAVEEQLSKSITMEDLKTVLIGSFKVLSKETLKPIIQLIRQVGDTTGKIVEHLENSKKTTIKEKKIEKQSITTGNPEKVIESKEDLIKALKELLPAMEEHYSEVGKFGKCHRALYTSGKWSIVDEGRRSQI